MSVYELFATFFVFIGVFSYAGFRLPALIRLLNGEDLELYVTDIQEILGRITDFLYEIGLFVIVLTVLKTLSALTAYFAMRREFPRFFEYKIKYNPLNTIKTTYHWSEILNKINLFLAFLIGVGIFSVLMYNYIPEIVMAMFCSPACRAELGYSVLTMGVLLFVAVVAVLTLFEFGFKRMKFMKDVRMSDEEIKRERKEDSGDPQIKARRRQMMRE